MTNPSAELTQEMKDMFPETTPLHWGSGTPTRDDYDKLWAVARSLERRLRLCEQNVVGQGIANPGAGSQPASGSVSDSLAPTTPDRDSVIEAALTWHHFRTAPLPLGMSRGEHIDKYNQSIDDLSAAVAALKSSAGKG